MSIIRKNEPVHDYLKLAEGAHADEIAKLTKTDNNNLKINLMKRYYINRRRSNGIESSL